MDLLSQLGFVFPSNRSMVALAAVQCLLVVLNGINEYANPTPYSKFAKSPLSSKTAISSSTMIPSRQGMVLLYLPSMITSIGFILSNYNNIATTTMAVYLVGIHFTKRVLESLFLHRYSGGMELNASILIGSFYTLVSVLIIMTAQQWMRTTDSGIPGDGAAETTGVLIQKLGLGMFVVGTLGNLYHHYLLRQLRSPLNKSRGSSDNKKRYVPPTGGLFDYVVGPHYLFEIIAFLGIACTSLSIHSLLVALGMASYLTGRALRTLKFYQETFDEVEFSRNKKALIPMLL
jgi:very-long-chain enoyl-CoA reductase